MPRQDFTIDLSQNDMSHLKPNQQVRLEKLKQKFNDKLGEEYLQENGYEFETFAELKSHWQEIRIELKEDRQEQRQQEKQEKLEQKFDDKLGEEYLEEHGHEFETFAELKSHWQEIKKEKQNQDDEEESPDSDAGNEPIQFNSETNTYTIDVGVSAAELNTLIENAEPSTTIILKNGNHEFTETIRIERDDITFSGQSEEGTILNFTFAEGTGGNAIELTGGDRIPLTTLETFAEAGATQITLSDSFGISAGDVIYLTQANTMSYLLENGWSNVSFEDADSRPFREMIVRVAEVDGNTLTLESPLPYDFDGSLADVFSTNLLENVALSDFTVTSGIEADPNYYDYVNSFPEFNNTGVIFVSGADGLDLSGISILDAPSSAFDFRSTIDLTADNLYVNGAHNLGSGGNGYGVNLYETFDANINDIEIYNVRHAVLFSSWNAEAGNYIEVTQTNRDINFHGSPDTNNEVVVLRSVLDYDSSQNTGSGIGFWDIVSGGGSSHAKIDIFEENSVVFSYAEGSTGTEIIYGADGGAYLDGKGSQDVIIGGNGDDVIIGGTSQDVLSGGEGADMFVFTLGDSFDAITDFSGDEEGDRILISNPDIQSFDDLLISQNDTDAWVRYGSSSTIIFSDLDAALLEPEFFMFNTGDLV